jgi:hypothetical protein
MKIKFLISKGARRNYNFFYTGSLTLSSKQTIYKKSAQRYLWAMGLENEMNQSIKQYNKWCSTTNGIKYISTKGLSNMIYHHSFILIYPNNIF